MYTQRRTSATVQQYLWDDFFATGKKSRSRLRQPRPAKVLTKHGQIATVALRVEFGEELHHDDDLWCHTFAEVIEVWDNGKKKPSGKLSRAAVPEELRDDLVFEENRAAVAFACLELARETLHAGKVLLNEARVVRSAAQRQVDHAEKTLAKVVRKLCAAIEQYGEFIERDREILEKEKEEEVEVESLTA